MHQALGISELLQNIFQWSDRRTNVSNALVCKLWQNDGLNAVWRVITDLRDLFRFFGPTTTQHIGQYCFEPPLTRERWTLFQERYAWRVHKLRCERMDPDELSLLDTIARFQHSKPVFPNLQAIEWRIGLDSCGYGDHSVIFMHSSVRSFQLFVNNEVGYDIFKEYSIAVSDYMPSLKVFQIEVGKNSQAALNASLTTSLGGLRSVETITLPAFADLSCAFDHLTPLNESLRTLRFTRAFEDVGSEQMPPLNRVRALPNLTELSLHTPYETFTHFLRESNDFAPRLLRLTISSTSRRREAPCAIKDLLEVISHQFTGMQRLALRFDTRFPPETLPQTPNVAEVVHFVHIEPILGCKTITHFAVTHPLPLVVREKDVVKLASSWPSLRSMVLCDDPQVEGFWEIHDQLNLRALLPLSRSCPLLEELRMRVVADIRSENSTEEEIVPFRRLTTFSPGNQTLFFEKVDVIGVAMFLSQLLPTSCEIKFDTCWDPEGKAMMTWNGTWSEVKKGLAYIEEYEKRGKDRKCWKQVEVAKKPS
ncbi:hypothetical protein E1B28_011940 [Marasmius oreades]|uniref:F-box domain-containing protein n=1 Tax=Marasmius oreades TaxID=181124 RepID=A0A9P7RR64_9AGAR|nr:uncharacterized protein E1B28_011940 [Marasmius oreades]KAG7087893.1 hypothetical protein E1B28_011940 [Marasmius oreades]